eukprot:scaffold19673_cov112-Isochrysis_galbana.AAC.1
MHRQWRMTATAPTRPPRSSLISFSTIVYGSRYILAYVAFVVRQLSLTAQGRGRGCCSSDLLLIEAGSELFLAISAMSSLPRADVHGLQPPHASPLGRRRTGPAAF